MLARRPILGALSMATVNGQFLAIGTFSTVRNLTNSSTLTWISAVPSIFPVNTNTAGTLGATGGIVSAFGNGSATIPAEATNPTDGSIQAAPATLNTTGWLVAAPSAAGTPKVVHCGPGSTSGGLGGLPYAPF